MAEPVLGPIHEYADHWMRYTAIRVGRPFDIRLTRKWIADHESGRPGFASALRHVALNALGEDDAIAVRSAIAVLSSVGTPDDIPAILSAGQHFPGAIATDARTTVFEIEHRAPAI